MTKFLHLMGLGLLTYLSSATAAPAAVTWTAQNEHSLVVSDVSTIAPGAYCVVGADLDTQSARTQAVIQTINSAQSKPTWVTHAPLTEKGLFQNRFTSCSAIGESVYGLEEVDTQGSSGLSQTLIFVSRFDKEGHRIARKQVSIDAKRPWAIGLASSGQTLYLLVGEQETRTKNSLGGMRLVSMPAGLEDQHSITIFSGSFFFPSKLHVAEQGLFLVGPFAKNSQEQDAALAAASLTLNGKYRWAHHFPYPANKAAYSLNPHTLEARASFISNGELQSQAVNATGNATAPITVKSASCRAIGHADAPNTAQIFSLDCERPPHVVSTNLPNGNATAIHKLDQKPLKHFDLSDSVVLVTRSNGDTPEYQFLRIQK